VKVGKKFSKMAQTLELKDIPNVDVTAKVDSLEDDLFKIYSELFKDVKKEDLVFEELKVAM